MSSSTQPVFSVCQQFCSPLSFRNFFHIISVNNFTQFVDISFVESSLSSIFSDSLHIYIGHYFQSLCALFSVMIRTKFKIPLLLVTFCCCSQYIPIFHWKGFALAYCFCFLHNYIGSKWKLEFDFKEQDYF